MTAPTVSPLPTPPSRQDPETFADRSDAFVGALPLFQTEINTLGTFVNNAAVASEADAVSTAADRVQTGLDATATAADRVQTSSDATTTTNNLAAFEESYIGQYASDTAADASGKTIVDGVFYFKTTTPTGLRIYNGVWSTAILDANGAMLASNNLSDLTNVPQALTNLGITATATEVNYTAGVTSPIQTQLDNKVDSYLIKSSAYTASVGERVAADVSGAAWTLNLPATPATGALVIAAIIVGDPTVNLLTVSGNGNNIVGAATFGFDKANVAADFIYNGTEWKVAI
jgi:hypothetical protein